MCGLVGMAGNLNAQTNKMFRDMLIFDQVRGNDSTGVATVGMGSNSGVMVEKVVGAPSYLWDWGKSKMFSENGILSNYNKVVIGHNRAATLGKVTEANAHPFTMGHITGVHNGTLSLYRDLEGYDEHDTDSQCLFDTIAKRGIDDCWKSFYGAAAIVFWNDTDQTLNIIRNDQRPLVAAYSEKKDAIFWASEDWMIAVAANRANVSLFKNESGKIHVDIPKANWLYTMKPTALSCPLVEERELEKKSFLPTSSYGYNNGASSGYNNDDWEEYRKSKAASYVAAHANDKTPKVKSGWSDGLPKAEKEVVGRRFRLYSVIEMSSTGHYGSNYDKFFYMYGETDQKERVEVYPTDEAEYKEWKALLNGSHKEHIYAEFLFRPRVTETYSKVCYRVSSACISVPHSKTEEKPASNVIQLPNLMSDIKTDKLYNSFNGRVTEQMWNTLMDQKDINHTCGHCNNPLSIEQHDKLKWLSNRFVMCEDCANDQDTVSFCRSYC